MGQGIPATPHNGIPMDAGIPMDDGIAKGPPSVNGIPIHQGPIPAKELEGPFKCVGTTKKGNPCRAWARTDSSWCTGHSL